MKAVSRCGLVTRLAPGCGLRTKIRLQGFFAVRVLRAAGEPLAFLPGASGASRIHVPQPVAVVLGAPQVQRERLVEQAEPGEGPFPARRSPGRWVRRPGLGMIRAGAASTARSVQSILGLGLPRRSTATSWRRIRISAFFDAEDRASRASQDSNAASER